jgi:NADPH-dependent F420 reductase
MPGLTRASFGAISLIGGTGKLGPALALRLARAGLPVVIGSRDAERARERAAEIGRRLAETGGGAEVSGAVNAEAAKAGEIAFVTVPWEGQEALLPGLAEALSGRIVVSTAVPVRFVAEVGAVVEEVVEGSSAEQVAVLLSRSRVVAGFHTVSSAHLRRLDRDLDEDVLLCGDDVEAKAEVGRLTELIPGLRVVDAGRLDNARLTERLAVLLLNVNHLARRTAGVRLTGL